jgi:hypothetical protein
MHVLCVNTHKTRSSMASKPAFLQGGNPGVLDGCELDSRGTECDGNSSFVMKSGRPANKHSYRSITAMRSFYELRRRVNTANGCERALKN